MDLTIEEQLEKYFAMSPTIPLHGIGDLHIDYDEIIYKATKFTPFDKRKLVFIIRDNRVMLIDGKIKKTL